MAGTAEQEREAWGVWGKRTLDSIIEVIVERDETVARIAVLEAVLRDVFPHIAHTSDCGASNPRPGECTCGAGDAQSKITTTLAAVPTGETK